jgi:riboflavin biosynthesis pyrimidine reductase
MQRVGGPLIGENLQAEIPMLYDWPDSAISHERPWVRCNMVMSLDGAIAGPDGKSASIGSSIDKKVFSAVRRDSDVILVGAGTARDEGYRPSAVPIAVVSNKLGFTQEMPLLDLASATSPRSLIITNEKAIAQAPAWLSHAASFIPSGESSVDLNIAIAGLHDLGLDRIHCEGGPALLTALIQAEVLDELLLTVTPMLVGGSSTLLTSAVGDLRGQFTQILTEDGTLLLRFIPHYSASAAFSSK